MVSDPFCPGAVHSELWLDGHEAKMYWIMHLKKLNLTL